MQKVLVLSNTRVPLMPCHPARARELLDKGKAAVFKQYPFTIILKNRDGGDTQSVELKVDPGSKVTGMAIVADHKKGKTCLGGFNIEHRGAQIKHALMQRAAIRRQRRSRNTRYRQARFLNRTKPKGWIAPSIKSRVFNMQTWINRLVKLCPVTSFAVEVVKFDTQKMQNAEITGIQYRQGTLFGQEVREYLLDKHNYTCVYCSGASKDKRLEKEHILAKSNGGANSISNLTIACRTCNKHKGSMFLTEWLTLLQKSKLSIDAARAKNVHKLMTKKVVNLRDATAVNITRKLIADWCFTEYSLSTTTGTGAMTSFNRKLQGYEKDHWIDAACCAESGIKVHIPKWLDALNVKAIGKTNRQMRVVDCFGFPSTKTKGPKTVFGFKTGDICTGKHGIGRIVINRTGYFNIFVSGVKKSIKHSLCTFLQKSDGYKYSKNKKSITLIVNKEQNTNKYLKSILNKKFTVISSKVFMNNYALLITIGQKPV